MLHLLGLVTRDSYEVLKQSGRVRSGHKLLFAGIFAAMTLLWVGWFAMCPFDPFPLRIPSLVRWTGLGAVILGWGLGIGAVVQLRGLEDIDRLITTGLFSRIRHPLYTAFVFWIVGWSLFHGAGLSMAVGILGIGSILFWRRLEEQALISRYGDLYRDYRARTWF
ncbi:isoprenylcysteine carboxylmethyltransferase family protein [candidate division KSB1 bacterium]|nr:isoprenylcysteine carboxylmethyltransferase family protein [candidate division KSB1 bacterium]